VQHVLSIITETAFQHGTL